MLSKMKGSALVENTSMSYGELAPGEGNLDLATGVAMLLLVTVVAVAIGSGRQAVDDEEAPVH